MALPAPLPRPANLPDPQARGGIVLRGPTLGTKAPLPLGQILLEDGALDPGDLLKATVIGQRRNLPLAKVLLSQGMVTPVALAKGLARQWRTTAIDPEVTPADPRLIDAAGAGFCLRHGILPWRRIGGVTWIATACPKDFADCLAQFPPGFDHVRMLLCSRDQAAAGVLAHRRTHLVREAESRVAAKESCRTGNQQRSAVILVLLALAVILGLAVAPAIVVGTLTAWAVLTLVT